MRARVVGALLISTVAFADNVEVDDLPGPPLEAVKHPAKVGVPPLPAFELPVPERGYRWPRELRLRGRTSFDSEVRVRGYVTEIYDCPAQLASVNPEATRTQLLLAIEENPLLCEQPKFYLGDRKDTSREASIQISEVPRPPTRGERQRMSDKDLRALPTMPKIARGDYVTVIGTWAVESAHDYNPDGLLIFKSLAPATPSVTTPATTPAPSPKEPQVSVMSEAPMRAEVKLDVRNNSVDHLNTCNKAVASKHYEVAFKECQIATKLWPGNHHAWYAWAAAHIAQREWAEARVAVERAVALRPDLGMYQMYLGISLYEAEIVRAREQQARRENKRAEEIILDPSGLKLDAARDAFLRATKLSPSLWRAHYYLGRLYRDLDDPRRAAANFSKTITLHPAYHHAYIALIQLYRRWDYLDQAIAVANVGTVNVQTADAADMWFEHGMAHVAKRGEATALQSFGAALGIRPEHLGAKFERGQILARKGEVAAAKRDLEEVAKSDDPRLVSEKQIATQLLAQIASRKR